MAAVSLLLRNRLGSFNNFKVLLAVESKNHLFINHGVRWKSGSDMEKGM